MRWLALIVGAIVISACGSLKVQVDVIDPAYVTEHADQPLLRSALQVVIHQTDDDLRNTFEDQKKLFKEIYLTTAKGYRARAKSEPEAEANLIAAARSLEETAVEEHCRDHTLCLRTGTGRVATDRRGPNNPASHRVSAPIPIGAFCCL